MSFKQLIEIGDKKIREDIGDYYFISKSRMDELIRNFEEQCSRIAELSNIVSDQQNQIKKLQDELIKNEDIT